MGLRSKKGKKLTLHVFLKMLRNPVYIGQMKSQKWGTRKGLHEPIVSERVFRNVQLVLSGKKPIALRTSVTVRASLYADFCVAANAVHV
jgi:hypothetical protein